MQRHFFGIHQAPAGYKPKPACSAPLTLPTNAGPPGFGCGATDKIHPATPFRLPQTRLTVSQRVNRIRKEEQNFPICNNMDVLGGRDAERNKSQRDKYCMTPLTVESKKYNKLGNITKKMEQTSGYVQGSGARAI